MVGHVVTITKTNGEIIEGVFHTFCPFEKQREGKNVYVIKGVKRIASSDVAGNTNDAANNNSSSHEPFQEGSTVLLSSSHVLKVHIKSLRLDSLNQPSNSEDMFRTDAEISGQRGGTDRLVAAGSVWTDGSHGGVTASLGGLEDTTNNTTKNNRGGMFQGGSGSWRDKASANNHVNTTSSGLSGTIGDWDQFSANEKRFNVKASYDENLYTTALDYGNLDSEKLAEAERIAHEIENTVSTNIHVMEERGQKISNDYDEEDLYSGVLKKKVDETKDEGGKGGEKKKEDEEAGKVMNYAAAAGAVKVTAATETAAATSSEQVSSPNTAASKEKDNETTSVDNTTQDVKANEDKEASKPKLNPNAKEFTFNPSAKSFTPSFGAPAPAPAALQQPHMEYPAMQHPGMMANYHPGMQYMQPGTCLCLCFGLVDCRLPCRISM
jgi:PAB1-binding protein PBP1